MTKLYRGRRSQSLCGNLLPDSSTTKLKHYLELLDISEQISMTRKLWYAYVRNKRFLLKIRLFTASSIYVNEWKSERRSEWELTTRGKTIVVLSLTTCIYKILAKQPLSSSTMVHSLRRWKLPICGKSVQNITTIKPFSLESTREDGVTSSCSSWRSTRW